MDDQFVAAVEQEHDGLEQPPVGVEAEAQFPCGLTVVDRVGDQEDTGGLKNVGVADPVLSGGAMDLHASSVIRNGRFGTGRARSAAGTAGQPDELGPTVAPSGRSSRIRPVRSAKNASSTRTASALETDPEERWTLGGFRLGQCFSDLAVSKEANDVVARYIRERLDEIVEDPEVAELLKPYDHPVGTKRICVDTDYYATFNQDDVFLVDVRSAPITRLTEWGLSIAGFPNLFLVTGPGSPSVLSNMVTSIEQHVDWITDHICYLEDQGLTRSEASPEAEDAWVQHVNDAADTTLFPQANSWYLGANVPCKPRVFMPHVGGVGAYRATCDEVAAKQYEGFSLV